jgi:hypothetical protein
MRERLDIPLNEMSEDRLRAALLIVVAAIAIGVANSV